MSSPLTESATWIEQLRAQLVGRLVTPEEPEYEQMRVVAAGHVDARPAAIARVANAADVAAAIAMARRNALALAVRSGGHDGAGYSTVEGGLVIDLRDMKRLETDRQARTAWAETGLTAADVVKATAEQGLVIGFGDTGSVGIGGITLGGGIGYLVRKHGLTIDNLLAAEIVTADGQLLRVDAQDHPELFWAIRGGGGNFGVAVRFLYGLHPAETFVGGILVLPATAEALGGFMAAAEAAPDEVSTIANLMNCPPLPFVPEEHHGQPVILAMLGHTGGQAAGERAMGAFRAVAPPIADLLRPMPYAEMFVEEEGAADYRPKATGRTFFIDQVDSGKAQAMVDAIAESDATMRAVQLRVLGGAMARVAKDATAFAHRDRKIMAIVVSFCEDEGDRAARRRWVLELAAKLDDGAPGAYVNFLDADDAGRVRDAYPGAAWERLMLVKAEYDPDNLFRRNQNIPPAR